MREQVQGEATRLLTAVRMGDAQAAERLVELLYGELHAMACAQGRRGQTLQPTALVHEVWLKLHGSLGSIDNRVHFLRLASKAMRQVLSNHAREARALKRGEGRPAVTLDRQLDIREEPIDVVALDDSLIKLSKLNERQAGVVQLRFLCSLTIAETAATLGVSPATVENDWTFARAWLRRELAKG